MFDSLWGDDFAVAAPQQKQQQKKVIEKVSKPKKVTTTTERVTRSSGKVTTAEKLSMIEAEVNRILGVYKDQTVVIRTEAELADYIDKAIINSVIAVDTETNNSLVPLTCKIMGLCLYTPGMKNAYIPVNHENIYTGELLPDQLTEQQIHDQLARLQDVQIIMHNGKFDFEVIKCTCDIELEIFWDTMIASRILDENERANLKQQYISKIDPSIEKYSIEKLFEGIEYAKVSPELFALYAATDAFMTYKLYEWQKAQFQQPGYERMYNLFKNIEMPIVRVCADMELAGIEIDTEYGKRLSAKYHKKLDAVDKQIEETLHQYDQLIAEWRKTPEANYKEKKVNKKGEETWGKSKSEQLSDPMSVTSPTQLAIFFYDVLKHPVVDKKSPRGTGEEILLKMDYPIVKLILEKRGLEKIIGTYVDKLPQCVIPQTGRLHAHFNQIGADTGRFSSSDPNLQNIPSHLKDIRMLFRAAEGKVLVGSDFSQQEPRLLCSMAGDQAMITAYRNKQDLYATIATKVYNNGYWDNMEHYEDGSPNPEGKKRRSNCKSILLGLMYGRGAASIAEQINQPIQEAQKIIDTFFKGYPAVKKWIDKTQEDAKVNGYVEDHWGRRRRLPDILRPPVDVRYTDKNRVVVPSDFNPLLGSTGKYTASTRSDIDIYRDKALAIRGRKEMEKLKAEAFAKGIEIHENGGFIAQAERQCVNARIQGGAATITKIAMTKVHSDPELKRMGFKMLICVHDELIGECPEEFAEACGERLSQVMIESVAEDVACPMKCDATITHYWYEDEVAAKLQEKFAEKVKNGEDPEAIKQKFLADNEELTYEQLEGLLSMKL